MKQYILTAAAYLSALSLFLYGCSSNSFTSSSSIRVTTPAPASIVNAGTTCDIRWSVSGQVDNTVAIDLYSDTGFVQSVSPAAPNTGSFSWTVSTALPQDSSYRIKIAGTVQTSTYGYSGLFTIVNNNDRYEPDNSVSLATHLDTNDLPQKHRIFAADTDWFKFEATSGRSYCIQTHGSADTYLCLYATNAFTLLAGNDNGGVDRNALIVWTCVSSGTYYFRVTTLSRSTAADYSIDVRTGGAILAITSPVSGTSGLTSGSTVSIDWAYSTNSGNTVSLYAFRNDSSAFVIVSGTSNNGFYSWTIPWTLPTSPAYRIMVVSDNDTSVHDLSDQFSITQIPSALTVSTPTSSTRWNTGSSYSIYWTYSGNFGSYVKLDLYDSTAFVMTIASNAYMRYESADWTVPSSLKSGPNYRIRITSTSDTSIYDFSDPFTITKIPTTLTMTTPSASTNWNTGSTYSIYWTYTGTPGTYVNLTLWDSTSPVTSITSLGLTANGTYSWTIPPTIASGNYRMKITSSQDSTIYSFSSFFKITNIPTSISVRTPDSTTVWNAGSSIAIVWYYTGSVGAYATITLYNDMTFVQTISTSGLMPPGTQFWTIPSSLPGGTKYRVKVSSNNYPTIAAFSQYFTIVEIPGQLTVTIPTATSSWNTGTSYNINWTYSGATGSYVKLELYDSSTFVQTISPSTATTAGYVSWLVPSSLHTGGRYQIKVTSTTHDTVFSLSSLFTITNVPAAITVTSPSANDVINAGTSTSIYWNSSGPVPGSYVSISLVDSSGNVSPVNTGVYRTNNYYSWPVPITLRGGNKLRIRVASTADTTIAGYSGPFTIVPVPPRLTVTIPDTTTSWTAGYSYSIYWTYSGSLGPNVKIDLYDSTALVQAIATSVYTTNGSLLWLAPSTLQTDSRYRVKITSTTSDSVFGFSRYFRIVNSSLSDSYEPDSTFSLARTISAGAPAQDHTLTSGDKDWFSFSATAGTSYTIETFGSTDTYMNLFSTNGTTLISSNDDENGSNTNAKITWSCTAGGTYYFEITGSYGAVGNYTVSLN